MNKRIRTNVMVCELLRKVQIEMPKIRKESCKTTCVKKQLKRRGIREKKFEQNNNKNRRFPVKGPQKKANLNKRMYIYSGGQKLPAN